MITNGTHFGRYEIRSRIGAGGMGEVYLAQDTQPERNTLVYFNVDPTWDDFRLDPRFAELMRRLGLPH